MRDIRKFTEWRVWCHDDAEAEAFAKDLRASEGIRFGIYETVADCVDGADVVCTVTSATEPFLIASMISPGTHINLVGSSHRQAAEADSSLVRIAKFYVDFRASAMDQAGELLTAIDEGLVDECHIVAELGEVLAGKAGGRENDHDITIYKSLGVASQDVVTGRRLYDLDCERDAGVELTW